MTTPFQGGQCAEQYYVTGTVNLIRISDQVRLSFPCTVTDYLGQPTSISGPIIDFEPSLPLGQPSQGDSYYIVVRRASPLSDYVCGQTASNRIPLDRYIFDSFSASVAPAGSFSDSCGNVPETLPRTPSNPLPGQPSCPVSVPANSDFDVHSSAVAENVELVTYQSLGETRGVSLRYNSLAADPRPILHFRYAQVYNPNQLLIAKL